MRQRGRPASTRISWEARLGPAVVLCVLSSGCIVSERYVVSVPQSDSPEVVLSPARTIEFSTFHLSVKPFNARLDSTFNTYFLILPLPFTISDREDKASPPFFIEVAFHAINESIVFNPERVTLAVAGLKYKPSGMVLPAEFQPLESFGRMPYQGLNFCWLHWSQSPPYLPAESRVQPLQQIQIAKGKMGCTRLSFPITPPPPEQEYSLSIHGLEVDGTSMQPLPIRFVRGIAYFNDKVFP